MAAWPGQVSMTENYDPLENPVAGRVNDILRQEYLRHYTVRSLDEAARHLERALFLYNYKRPHLSCVMQSLGPVNPAQEACRSGYQFGNCQ